MKFSTMAIAFLSLQLSAAGALAQAPDDDLNAIAAALPLIMTKVPPGTTALVYNDRSVDLAKRLGAKIGRTIEHESSKLVCHHDSRMGNVCALSRVSSLVNLVGVRVTDQAATVTFNIETPSGSTRVPIEHELFAVKLKRSGNVWEVVQIKRIAIS